MVRIRGEEQWARRCISRALGDVEVRHHDDGTTPGMYDLDIVYPSGATGAVEITAAADAESIELWNLMNGEDRWIEPGIAGGWVVHLLPQARGRRVRKELPDLLGRLERRGVKRLDTEEDRLHLAATDLGIARLWQGDTDYPGSIYPHIKEPLERSAGYVPASGDPVAEWLTDWLRGPEQAHNLNKLTASNSRERHLFVIFPGFTIAPFEVTDLLMRDDAPLPTIAPDLPAPLTHIWGASTWTTGVGMRWSPDRGWERFLKDV